MSDIFVVIYISDWHKQPEEFQCSMYHVKGSISRDKAWTREYRPFQNAGRLVGLCSGKRGRLQALLTAALIIYLTADDSLNIDFSTLEGSTVGNSVLEAGKTIIGSVGAIACLWTSIRQGKADEELCRRVKEATESLGLRAFSLKATWLKAVVLFLALTSCSLYSALALCPDHSFHRYSFLVEYYAHLVMQAAECKFVAQMKTLTAMYEDQRSKLSSARSNVHLVRSWIRSERLLFKLSVQVSKLFGPYLLASFITNFMAILTNLYFLCLYLIRKKSTGETIPQSTILYLNLNVYILIRVYQVLSCGKTLQTKAKDYTLEFDSYILKDYTRRLQINFKENLRRAASEQRSRSSRDNLVSLETAVIQAFSERMKWMGLSRYRVGV